MNHVDSCLEIIEVLDPETSLEIFALVLRPSFSKAVLKIEYAIEMCN